MRSFAPQKNAEISRTLSRARYNSQNSFLLSCVNKPTNNHALAKGHQKVDRVPNEASNCNHFQCPWLVNLLTAAGGGV